MKNLRISFFVIAILSGCNSQPLRDYAVDEREINQTIKDWDHAWDSKDIALAVKHYANETDWTYAFD